MKLGEMATVVLDLEDLQSAGGVALALNVGHSRYMYHMEP